MTRRSNVVCAGSALVALVAMVAGCEALQSGAPPISSEMTQAAAVRGNTEIEIAQGRRLLASRCISCHSLEPVVYYTPEEWRVNVRQMADRSGLNEEEERLIVAYLVAAREAM